MNESPNVMDDAEGSPVVAYALATSALLFAACLMCICFMCCAKCPEWRRQRRERSAKEQLLKHCSKIKFTSKCESKKGIPSDTCAVCLEDFREKEAIIVCPCKHGYHKKCISDWLVRSACCPVCKMPVTRSSITKSTPPVSDSNEATPLLIEF